MRVFVEKIAVALGISPVLDSKKILNEVRRNVLGM